MVVNGSEYVSCCSWFCEDVVIFMGLEGFGYWFLFLLVLILYFDFGCDFLGYEFLKVYE